MLTHPVYFTAGRRSVSGGIALGIFIGLLPIPGQTALAILGALLLRVNLPLAALSVWISNPLTFGPIFYFAERVGTVLLDIPTETMPLEPDMSWLSWLSWLGEEITLRWRPLMWGSLLIATSAASISYLAISMLWHILTLQRYRARHRKDRK